MADVYQQAGKVLLWLGIELNGIEPPLAKLKDTSDPAEEPDLRRIDGPSVWFRQPTFPGAEAEALELVRTYFGGCEFVIFQRPWFSRMWIIQEMFLAQDILVHCGNEIMT